MTPAHLQTIEEVFHAALDCEPDQLDAFLDKTCAGDGVLRGKVEALLASHQQAGSFIETPVAALDTSIIENGETDLLIGQTMGHYQISKPIGAGGMGAVYLARRADQQYEKQVAIKLIKRGMDTDSVLRHFRNERQILASFDHPNIARLLDGGATDSGLPYFVMEYVEGLPIDAYCDRQALPIIERLKLFRQVCAAVTYAHRYTVIHRDIKPSNILVTSDGTPKLLDFGIAKILQPGGEAEPFATMTELRLMTPEYASPEQVRAQPLTTATDVYSLGVVLYRLLTGQKPYRLKTGTPEEISRAIIEQEPPRPSTALTGSTSVNPQSAIQNSKLLRGDLDNIVLMALRKEPERRYQSVEQFSEDIRRHLEALPVRARKDTLAYRSAKFVRRNRAATAAAALVFLSLLGGIIATTWEAHRARAQEAVARVEKSRAERRFNDVRQLAHSVLFDYYDAIKDLPGATRVRERLVKDALVYLDSLAGEASGEPALQRELAAAYDRIGDVRGGTTNANLGDRAGAMESYLKAVRIREALVAANPHDVQSRRELADSHRKVGWQLMDTSESGRGLEHLRKAVTLYLEATAEQPGTLELRYELAGAHNDLGLALEDRGDLAGALDQHRRALALLEELVASNPSEQRYRRRLSVIDENIGRALFLSGDVAGAIEINDKALALRAALAAQDPTNADYRRILAISYQNGGDYRDQLGDKRDALDSFRKNISINEELLAADPANAEAHGDLAYSSQRVGDLLAALGDNSQALLYYRKSLQMYEKVSADAPEDLTGRFRLAISGAGVAKIQARLGERAPALEECRKAIALLGEMAEDPTNASHRSMRAQAYAYLGDAYVALATSREASQGEITQHWNGGRDMYRRSLSVWEEMRSRGILSVPDAGKPEEVAREITKCDAFLGK
jgi:eukaryotic-like serine/threonine-protein kinase